MDLKIIVSNSEQIKKNETILRDLSEQAQEAAPVPEVIKSQPLKELSPTQSESHSLLYFTIQNSFKSRKTMVEQSIDA